ncbi:Ger(x)C family spore germination protein [Halobacillus naozhouensis]|uniref:Ger(X)C family spore germination protein n=1 Tax=Halobacillus naozhouensis TaxID=554880 RepID=A0ABY8J0K9_9BACI|nr:Ger(x)C family spore germination protein [Halobacillus naozhouensis]WFT75132.1 Ger(x)C family spore germination protein [Halobacillus naozhouensis]
MKYKWLCPSIIACLMLLTSCMPNVSVEDAAIVQIAGYDFVDKDQIKGTFAVAQYTKSEQKTSANEVYLSTTANTVKNIHAKLQRQSSRPISTGKLTIALYDKELAKDGMSKFIDSLSRDPRIGRDILLAIVDGSTEEMVKMKYEQNNTTASYMKGMIEHNMYSNFPNTNLHNYLHAYFGQGIDGFLPYLEKIKDHIKLKGIAFLKDGRLAHTIPYSKSLFFKMMKEEVREGVQEMNFQGEGVMMESISSDVEIHIKGETENPEFLVKLNVRGIVNEVSNLSHSSTPPLVEKIEKEFTKFFNEQCTALVHEFQEQNIDPIGFGNALKNRRRNVDMKKWQEQYPEVPIEVEIQLEITETGIST